MAESLAVAPAGAAAAPDADRRARVAARLAARLEILDALSSVDSGAQPNERTATSDDDAAVLRAQQDEETRRLDEHLAAAQVDFAQTMALSRAQLAAEAAQADEARAAATKQLRDESDRLLRQMGLAKRPWEPAESPPEGARG